MVYWSHAKSKGCGSARVRDILGCNYTIEEEVALLHFTPLVTQYYSQCMFVSMKVCRLVCDQESSWHVKLQALDALNTLVSIGNTEEERLDFRAEVILELLR